MAKKFSVAKMQAKNLPHLTFSDVFQAEQISDEDRQALDDYLKAFVKGDVSGICVSCGEQQGGSVVDGLIGKAKFKWGLVNGEGYCSNCGYPARAIHRDIGPIEYAQIILQYHPDMLAT